jgi:NitT/TauT family transport system substrate-binding protein
MSRNRWTTFVVAVALLCGLAVPSAHGADEGAKKKFKIAWTIYVGWMPWGYAQDHGIVKKWADKYGIDVELVQINDYIESINQYTAGGFDGVTLTNMDGLTIPAAGGVDTTMVICGDFSNGNDAIVLKGGKDLKDIKGRKVHLVELSVSHYALARALGKAGLKETDVTVVNTSDADIVSVVGTPEVTAATLWNPQLGAVLKMPGVNKVFDSSEIPGEIIDILAINTKTLKDHPELGKALTGAWFEVLALMNGGDAKATEAKEAMAKASGTDLAGFESQLKTTKLFYTPKEVLAFTTSDDLVKTMELVRTFSFEHGLMGAGAKSVDAIGMEFPGGKTLGDKSNIKLRFDPTFVQMAADGKL